VGGFLFICGSPPLRRSRWSYGGFFVFLVSLREVMENAIPVRLCSELSLTSVRACFPFFLAADLRFFFLFFFEARSVLLTYLTGCSLSFKVAGLWARLSFSFACPFF